MARTDCGAFSNCGGNSVPPGTGNFDCCPKKFILTAVDYTIQEGEDDILVDATSNDIVITLPVLTKDTNMYVLDYKGKATTHAIGLSSIGTGATINFTNLDKIFSVVNDIAICIYHAATKNWHVEFIKEPAAAKSNRILVNQVASGTTFNVPIADEQLIVVNTGVNPAVLTSAIINFTNAYPLSPAAANGQKVTVKDGTGMLNTPL